MWASVSLLGQGALQDTPIYYSKVVTVPVLGVYRKDPQQGGSVFRQPICETVTTGVPVKSVKGPETN